VISVYRTSRDQYRYVCVVLCFFLAALTVTVVQGRQLLYGWIQEHRRVPTPPALCDEYSYAGCISTPRVLQLVGGQLWQTPLPEINALRTR
jgi:sucrose-6-phosphate hydrolase SacC (GH32 family)